MLVSLAVYFRDPLVLLTHHDRSGRRLFCCTLCHAASCDDEPRESSSLDCVPEVERGSTLVSKYPRSATDYCPLRWSTLSQTEVMFLMGVNNGTAGLMQFYATPPNRQPPLISAVLSSLTVVAARPLSKLVLGDRKTFAAVQVRRLCLMLCLFHEAVRSLLRVRVCLCLFGSVRLYR